MKLSISFEEALKKVKETNACQTTLEEVSRYNSWEELLKDKKAPFWLYWYALCIIKGRWLEVEHIIKTSPFWAHHYDKDIIKGEINVRKLLD